METGMTKVTHEEIGFVSKEDLAKYMKFLDLGDILSKYSRMFDSNTGALTLTYLTLLEKNTGGGMIEEVYKSTMRTCLKAVHEMQEEVAQKLKEIEK